MRLKGRQALITGASQGLGRAIAEAFVREGASVLLCARQEPALSRAARELSNRLQPGQRVLSMSADVSDAAQASALVKKALHEFPALDVLVNNAGVYGPKGALEAADWDEWTKTVGINLLAPVYLCRALLPHFKTRRRGKIINLSGGGATAPLPRFSAYAASKAGLIRFTETLAAEAAESGIDVNAVAPGALNTRLLDEALAAGPERVGADFYAKALKQRHEGGTSLEKGAALCVFLASGESDGITGKLLSAVWDPWADLPRHRDELGRSDVYTLRRIVPADRGLDWEKSLA